jgi:hypothetical protein
MSTATVQLTKRPAFWGNIVGSHIERVGLARVLALIAGVSLAAPVFLAAHAVSLIHGSIISVLIKLPIIRQREHMYFGRYRIAELNWMDKIACEYCAYANGVNSIWSTLLDAFAEKGRIIPPWRIGLAGTILTILAVGASVSVRFGLWFVYGILISRSMGFPRTSNAQIGDELRRDGYASDRPALFRWAVRCLKTYQLRSAASLAQVESGFCPLKPPQAVKHAPSHHRLFFAADQVGIMRKTLSTVGTAAHNHRACSECSPNCSEDKEQPQH